MIKTNSTLAPIILFVYNRPWHTEQTLNSLKQNILALESTLYIYCDGPKENADKETIFEIKDVRNIIKQQEWCKEVYIIESEKNKGLAASIKNGISEILSKYGKIIVLEDDLVLSPYFLNYMNDALNYYANRQSVFSISSYNLPSSKMRIPEDYSYDVFVRLRNSSWGWGTWQDRWEQIDWETESYKSMSINEYIKNAFNRGGDDVYNLLQGQKTGKLNIWSIQFTLAHFVNHAVSITPVKSFVDNIGLDGSGDNCGIHKNLKIDELNKSSSYKFLDILYEDKRIINSFYNVYCKKKRPIWQKAINRISRSFGCKNIFVIKKKIYN